jgi:hypothetical protein
VADALPAFHQRASILSFETDEGKEIGDCGALAGGLCVSELAHVSALSLSFQMEAKLLMLDMPTLPEFGRGVGSARSCPTPSILWLLLGKAG